MRCPKCKFISFDDLSSCAKCGSGLSVLAAELRGTCTEGHPGFFLGPVVQFPADEDAGLSDSSQSLPPIDHGEINFDDTTGDFAPFAARDGKASGSDFNESVGVVHEDDISIELGDIMPIDLDQLDTSSLLPDDSSDTISLESDSPGTFGRQSSVVPPGRDDDIDPGLTGRFASTNLDLGLAGELPDIDLDDSNFGSGDDTAVFPASSAEDTLLTLDHDQLASLGSESELDLDDDLMAELAESSDDLDATTSLPKSAGLFDQTNLSATEEFSLTDDQSVELDESLGAELFDEGSNDSNVESSSFDFDPSATGEFDFSDSTVADLTGEFPPIPEGEEPELSGLDFSDIDVSDLVSPERIDDQLDSNTSAPVDADDKLVVGSEADDLPEVELFLEEDEEDIPPDLPS